MYKDNEIWVASDGDAKSDIEITAALIISSIAPRYDCGGSTLAFLTIAGAPSSSINDTTASPIHLQSKKV